MNEGQKENDRALLTKAMEGLLEVGSKSGTPILDSGKELTWDNKKIVLWAVEKPAGIDIRNYTDEKLTAALALSYRAAYYLAKGIEVMIDDNSSRWVADSKENGLI